MSEKRMTITRKIQLAVVGDKEEKERVYRYLRDGQYAQYQGLNLLMGQLASAYYANNRELKGDFNSLKKKILANSNELLNGIEFATGLDSKSAITRKVSQDFSAALKNGLAKGERTITNYKRTFPLMIRGRFLKFKHEYKDDYELSNKIFDKNAEIYIDFVNKIRFQLVLGNTWKSRELRTTVLRIFTGEYEVQESKISFDSRSHLMLYISLSIPVTVHETDKDTSIAVKLGEKVTAACVCSNHPDSFYHVGNAEEFLRVRTQLKMQRQRIQSNLKYSKGGHGRKRKLQAFDRLSKRESEWSKNYNHNISKEIINYAISQKASKIILEDLSAYKGNEFLTTQWAYQQLQDYISYKAKKNNIEVIYQKINLSEIKDVDIDHIAKAMLEA